MKKGLKVLAIATLGTLGLTACTNEQRDIVSDIQNNIVEKFKNDSSFENLTNANFSLNQIRICEKNNTEVLELSGKLSADGINSFTTISYASPEINVHSQETQKTDVLTSVNKIVKSNAPYEYTTYNVSSFEDINKTYGKISPKTLSLTFDGSEVLTLTDMTYDENTQKLSYTTNVENRYKYYYTTIVLAGKVPVPITNTAYRYSQETLDVSYTIPIEEYNAHKNDTTYLTGKLDEYVENNNTDYYTVISTNQSGTIYNTDDYSL